MVRRGAGTAAPFNCNRSFGVVISPNSTPDPFALPFPSAFPSDL
jgi:hypothetical protein